MVRWTRVRDQGSGAEDAADREGLTGGAGTDMLGVIVFLDSLSMQWWYKSQ